MSSIMRLRSARTGRWEGWEVIGVPLSSRRLLDLRCSGSDAPAVTPYRLPRSKRTDRDARPSRESGFVLGWFSAGPLPSQDARKSDEHGHSAVSMTFSSWKERGVCTAGAAHVRMTGKSRSGKRRLCVPRWGRDNRRYAMSQLEVADNNVAADTKRASSAYVPPLQRTE